MLEMRNKKHTSLLHHGTEYHGKNVLQHVPLDKLFQKGKSERKVDES
jgi:hypothetical protein